MAQAATTWLVLACLLMATITAGGGTSGTTAEALPKTTGGGVRPPAADTGAKRELPTVGGVSTTDNIGQPPEAEAVTLLPTVGGGLSTEALGGGKLPLWVQRRLLLALDGARPSLGNMEGTKRVVVAKNATSGDGQFASITAALAAQEDQIGSEQSILTIFIKEGVYAETLKIRRNHVILIGEGSGKTVITGNKSCAFDKIETMETATVYVHGLGFMAQDLTIKNTAGPKGEQAVALFSQSNFSLIYRCSIDGYQDTLSADAGEQVYLETDIHGTVDFVFGYARAVFIRCRLLVRNSGLGPGKANVVTAQGRNNPKDHSGFVFQNCSVTADEGANLSDVKTFLGRPWKNHSHVIFMESFLDSIVNYTGWLEWERRGPMPDTVVYLEYANSGPGADTSRRINTTGVRVLTDCGEAARYTADPFTNAGAWMPKDKEGREIIPYPRGLIGEPECPPAPSASA